MTLLHLFNSLIQRQKIFQTLDSLRFLKIFLLSFLYTASIYFILSSPNDYEQGWISKILYVHVPTAWIAILFFTLLGLSSLAYLLWRNPFFLLWNKAILPILILSASLTLITGSLWGKVAWGTGWVFDGRLTSMAFLLLAALFYLLLELADTHPILKTSLGVVNLLGVPIVKYSVIWWTSLHQSSTLTLTKTTLDNQIAFPLLLITFFFTLFSFLILELQFRSVFITLRKNNYYTSIT